MNDNLINLDFICNYPITHKLKYEIGFCKTCPLPIKFISNNLPNLNSVKFEIEYDENNSKVIKKLEDTEIITNNNILKIYLIITYNGSCDEKLERQEFNINAVSDCRNGDYSLIRLNTFTICLK